MLFEPTHSHSPNSVALSHPVLRDTIKKLPNVVDQANANAILLCLSMREEHREAQSEEHCGSLDAIFYSDSDAGDYGTSHRSFPT